MWFKLIHAAVDFIYPPECAWCMQPIDRKTLHENLLFMPELCNRCHNKMPAPLTNGCLRCGAPSGPYVDTKGGCIYCKDENYAFSETYAWGIYRGEIKQVCLLMKKPAFKHLTIVIGELLAQAAKSKIQAWQPDLVMPVPSRKVFWVNRTNPAPETLARVISSASKIRLVEHKIKKIRTTPRQVTLSPTERRKNLQQAYTVPDSSSIKDKKVLLVDGTMTTGSTLNVISKELITAGASAVYVLVFSRGIGLNIDN